jgi:tetratricopeptide (TPR) repeat protein
LESALHDYEEAIRLRPDYADAFYNRGRTRDAKGDLAGALQDYEQTIRFNPDHANSYYNCTIIRRKQLNHAQAIADFQKYLDLGGGNRDGDTEQVKKMIAELKQKL